MYSLVTLYIVLKSSFFTKGDVVELSTNIAFKSSIGFSLRHFLISKFSSSTSCSGMSNQISSIFMRPCLLAHQFVVLPRMDGFCGKFSRSLLPFPPRFPLLVYHLPANYETGSTHRGRIRGRITIGVFHANKVIMHSNCTQST